MARQKTIQELIDFVRKDHGDRLYNDHLTRNEGRKYLATERRVHQAILMQHMYFRPFQTITELYAFVYTYAANLTQSDFREQEDALFVLKWNIGMPPRGVLEVIGAIDPWRPKPVTHTPKWES